MIVLYRSFLLISISFILHLLHFLYYFIYYVRLKKKSPEKFVISTTLFQTFLFYFVKHFLYSAGVTPVLRLNIVTKYWEF